MRAAPLKLQFRLELMSHDHLHVRAHTHTGTHASKRAVREEELCIQERPRARESAVERRTRGRDSAVKVECGVNRLQLARIAGKRLKFHITDHYSTGTLGLRETFSDGTTHSHGTTLEPSYPPVHFIRKHAFNSFITFYNFKEI